MLALKDRNVVVCISGELVRLPNGDHGDGSVGFWAGVAAACGVSGSPFGANPHALLG